MFFRSELARGSNRLAQVMRWITEIEQAEELSKPSLQHSQQVGSQLETRMVCEHFKICDTDGTGLDLSDLECRAQERQCAIFRCKMGRNDHFDEKASR